MQPPLLNGSGKVQRPVAGHEARSREKQAPVVKTTGAVKNTLLVLQRKRGHGRRARAVVSCTCERTNRDNKSSDNVEDDLSHRFPPFRGSLHT
jgi:hypothetical protein